MSLDRAIKVAASGLDMQRARMEIIASNMANAHTTRTPEGGPYVRRLPVVAAERSARRAFGSALDRAVRGVDVQQVVNDPSPPSLRFEPGHPDASANGFVAYPNVDPAKEMVDLLSALRSYEANVNVVKVAGRMKESALGMVR
ncbi:MAG: flagellar basal body rod protein FlgC [Acidobacteriota bacterium]|nr:MAG: flagellar basal body rod protein FlgC [Acidobacteriota bacterium]